MTEPPINDQLDEILANYVLSEEAGNPVSRDELLKQHPDLADELNAFFSGRDRFKRLASPLSPEAARRNDLPAKVRYFGDYELLEEVAQGGMGVVYKARQTSLNRIVAVKMILSGHLATDADVRRFAGEAETAASLKHKAIVPIHEVGQQNGQHYFSMDFIEGRNLADVIRTDPPLPEQAARIVKAIAEAVDYAHDEGIVHRDIKPSNILIDDSGQVHITDFGLALRVEVDSDLTRTGQVLGTPSYMPPEQARGKRDLVGPASDIYSLGAVLYDLIAGRPPFRGESAADTIQQLIDTEPLSPRQLKRDTPRDLETICLKCLEKEPHKRYGTAALLADDLGRYLAGESVLARPVSRAERAWRWVKKNPVVSSTSFVLAAMIFAVAIISPIVATHQARLARDKHDLAQALSESLTTERETTQLLHRTVYNVQLARAQLVMQFDPVVAGRLLDDPEICKPDVREFTWRVLRGEVSSRLRELPAHVGPSPHLVFAPDSKMLAIASNHQRSGPNYGPAKQTTIQLWNIDTAKTEATFKVEYRQKHCFVFDPNSPTFIYARGSTIRFWDTDAHDLTRELETGSPVTALAISRDGSILAVANASKVAFWNLKSPSQKSVEFDAGAESIQAIAFSNDGRLLATAGTNEIRVWNRPTNTEHVRLEKGSNKYTAQLSFSSDDKKLINHGNGIVDLWDVQTTKRLPVVGAINDYGWESIAVSRSNNRIALVGDGEVYLWDMDDARVIWRRTRRGEQSDMAIGAAVSPNEEWLATTVPGKIQLWNLRGGTNSLVLRGHTDGVKALAFSPNNQVVASAGWDKEIRLWDPRNGKVVRVLKGHSHEIGRLAFSPNGRLLAACEDPATAKANWTAQPAVKLWEVASGTELFEIPSGIVEAFAFSPDGSLLATLGQDVGLWNTESGRRVATLSVTGSCIGFSNDGATLTVASSKEISQWDVQSATKTVSYPGHKDPMAFSRDGQLLACYSGRSLELWDWRHDKRVTDLSGHGRPIEAMAFSPDGKTVVTGSGDMTLRLWDPKTGQERAVFSSIHGDELSCVLFSPDGNMLASGSWDGTIRLWHAMAPRQMTSHNRKVLK
jgi:WD40 repeat protein/serine/threonine protein kinase